MTARDSADAHRVSTPLELFFDLTFVVAVSQASVQLHHGLIDGHAARAIEVYPMVFFAVWWAWMNFTWFASAYDTDDTLYRLTVFVQMIGVLVLAAGVPRAFAGGDFTIATWAYVVMRLAMVSQWIRASQHDPDRHRTAIRYAGGIAVLQVGWVARLLLHGRPGTVGFVALVVLELLVPAWAERPARTTWHPRHMAERYGLFTIIVLGESILSATVGVQVALDARRSFARLVPVIAGGLLIVFSLWWIYFAMPREQATEHSRATFHERMRGPFIWGYGHFFVFASAAATGAGLAVAVDHVTGTSPLHDWQAGAATTVPVAVYVATLWWIHSPYKASVVHRYVTPAAVAAILGTTFTPQPVLGTGIVVAALLVVGLAAEGSAAISTER
jgi:low temperature requirement protein LtrA